MASLSLSLSLSLSGFLSLQWGLGSLNTGLGYAGPCSRLDKMCPGLLDS
jgi:hypothetical protein